MEDRMSKDFSQDSLKNIKRKRQEWEKNTLKPALDRFKIAKSPNQFYTPLDIPDFDFTENVGFPGEYPYTAGSYASSVPGSGPVTGGYHIGGGGGLVRAGRYSGYGTA